MDILPTPKEIKSVVDGKIISPFYSTKYPLSNFYPCQFDLDGHTFHSSEQYFMYRKAVQFNDVKSRQEILKERDPKVCKQIGRKVKNFDGHVWTNVSYDIMVEALEAKFSQSKILKEYLLATGDSILVEAAPNDNIWGVGMCENALSISDPRKWKGENLLGKALMQVRESLRD